MDDEAASAADIRTSRSKILAGLAKIALCFPMVMLMAIIIYVYYAYVVTYCSTIEYVKSAVISLFSPISDSRQPIVQDTGGAVHCRVSPAADTVHVVVLECGLYGCWFSRRFP